MTRVQPTPEPPNLLFRGLPLIVGWLAATGLCVANEWPAIQAALRSSAGGLAWFALWNPETSLPLLVLMVLPWMAAAAILNAPRGTRRKLAERPSASVCRPHGSRMTTGALCLLSFSASLSIGMRPVELVVGNGTSLTSVTVRRMDLPPAYHDEFSYLLQSQTFLSGRISWPGMKVEPELFHQMHVLNEPRTASRYFPWTGIWMAPFLAAGLPVAGHWLAGALACGFFHRCLLKVLPAYWAAWGGVLIAISPALAVFSGLLLAHHPVLLALSVFLWAFLRLMDRPSLSHALTAGTGLTLAMLGRPMTAAGFALPWGLWILVQCVRQWRIGPASNPAHSAPSQLPLKRIVAGLSIPIITGFLLLGVMNQQITGNWRKSAYQLYTERFTPRHQYGFHNVDRARGMVSSGVLKSYDDWAVNLTPKVAVQNVYQRLQASFIWALGLPVLLFLLCAGAGEFRPRRGFDARPFLLAMSVVTLHLVHVPYWYDGILHFHYVFESVPILLMLAAIGLMSVGQFFETLRMRRLVRLWLTALLLSALLPAWIDTSSVWGPSRISLAVSEQNFSRVRFAQFRGLTESDQVRHPCLVLVDERHADPQLSYIVNPPDLTGGVLTCRHPHEPRIIDHLRSAFPERTLYVFDPETFRLTQLIRANSSGW